MNRRILLEEMPDGRLVISTNFASGKPEAEMSVAKISTVFYDLSGDIRELLDDRMNCPFQQGLSRMAWAERTARIRATRGPSTEDDDDIPF